MSRSGLSFISFVAWVMILSILATLSWGVYANWDRDHNGDGHADGFTLRVMDADWWDSSRSEVLPVIADAREKVFDLKEHVWGQSGALDQAEADNSSAPRELTSVKKESRASDEMSIQPTAQHSFQHSTQTSTPPSTHTAHQPTTIQKQPESAPTTPGLPSGSDDGSPRRQRLEERIANAHDRYTAGLAAYRRAQPAEDGAWGQAQWQAAAEARAAFRLVARLIDDGVTMEDYAALPDHRPEVVTFARKMLKHNQTLLALVERMLPEGSAPGT